MHVRFGELAKDEIRNARAYLEQQQPGLGSQFATEISRSSDRIARQPLLYPVEKGEVRKHVMNRFPYTIRYVVRGDIALVVAVSHHSRRPEYWIDRIESS